MEQMKRSIRHIFIIVMMRYREVPHPPRVSSNVIQLAKWWNLPCQARAVVFEITFYNEFVCSFCRDLSLTRPVASCRSAY
jgi:hypothetical protein